MKIQIINVEVVSKQNSKGTTYQQAEVTFKDLDSGKVNAKKIMDFASKGVFNTLADAKQGQVFDVVSVKEGDYWQWKEITRGSENEAQVKSADKIPVVRSTYETPEERAKKQVYIVKQSSLATALELQKHNNPEGVIDPDAVIGLAKSFVDWVFELHDPLKSITDMDDDIPF